MGHAIPVSPERIRASYVTDRSEQVRNMHLMSIGFGAFVGASAPDMLVGAVLGVATVKSIEYAAKQVALLGISLWVNK